MYVNVTVGHVHHSAERHKQNAHVFANPETEKIHSQHLTTSPLTNMRSIDLAASGAPQQARSSSPALVWLAYGAPLAGW